SLIVGWHAPASIRLFLLMVSLTFRMFCVVHPFHAATHAFDPLDRNRSHNLPIKRRELPVVLTVLMSARPEKTIPGRYPPQTPVKRNARPAAGPRSEGTYPSS